MSQKRFSSLRTRYRRPSLRTYETESRRDLARLLKPPPQPGEAEARLTLARLAAESTVVPTKVPEGRRTVSEAQMQVVAHQSDDRRYRYPRAEVVESRLGIRKRGISARDSTEMAREVEAARLGEVDPGESGTRDLPRRD